MKMNEHNTNQFNIDSLSCNINIQVLANLIDYYLLVYVTSQVKSNNAKYNIHLHDINEVKLRKNC